MPLVSRLSAFACTAAGAAIVVVAACSSDKKSVTGPNLPPECIGTQPANVVRQSNFEFTPATLHVKAGSAVTWVHCGPDLDKHTVTSDAGTELASPYIGKGEKYTHTFAATGSNPYHCIPHASFMTGTIVVDP